MTRPWVGPRPRPSRRLVETAQALVAELGGQDLPLLGVESEERAAGGLDVARGQGAVQRRKARTIAVARHRRRLMPTNGFFSAEVAEKGKPGSRARRNQNILRVLLVLLRVLRVLRV
jgi:hypothetical protein